MRALLLAVVALALIGCEPIGPIPGSTLQGETAAPPADWTNVASVVTVQVQTRPADPYSINIWCATVGRDFYIAAASETNKWAKYIDVDPDVRLRIGTTLYDLRAVRVTDAAELARVQAAYETKYNVGDKDNRPQERFVFRLDRRS